MMVVIQVVDENSVEISPAPQVWTDEEFMALNRDGHRYEIVDGELIDRGNSGAKQGYVSVILSSALFNWVSQHKLGAIFDSSTAFKMKSGNKRSPDISFVSKERLQGLTDLPEGLLEDAPDLAVEILSPGNTVAEIRQKLIEYFENGSRLVWVIDPIQKYALVYRCGEQPDRLVKLTDHLEGEETIPGFKLLMIDLFEILTFKD